MLNAKSDTAFLNANGRGPEPMEAYVAWISNLTGSTSVPLVQKG